MGAVTEPGRLDTWSRLDVLLDEGSFRPSGRERPEGGALTLGTGEILGRVVHVHARDAAIAGGLLSSDEMRVLADFLEAARRSGEPIIGIFEAAGCEAGGGSALAAQMRCLAATRGPHGGPELAVVLGQAVGFDALLAARCDFRVVCESGAELYMAGPERVRAVTGERLDGKALGGADVLGAAGVADLLCANEVEALSSVRRLLDLAAGQTVPAELSEAGEDCFGLQTVLPPRDRSGYDPAPILDKLLDNGGWIELGATRAANVLTGLGRLGDVAVGVVASRPDVLGGALDIAACRKAEAFAVTCRRLRLPMLVLIDCPGFLPGSAQEAAGLSEAAGRLAVAMAEVPALALTSRRGLGPAYAALSAGAAGRRFYWPGAGIGAVTPTETPIALGLADVELQPALSRARLAEALRRLLSSGTTP